MALLSPIKALDKELLTSVDSNHHVWLGYGVQRVSKTRLIYCSIETGEHRNRLKERFVENKNFLACDRFTPCAGKAENVLT
jgi:hypothetical protein